ncbi:glycosyltransferase family 2 protein [Actinomycetospora chiangmaiensis]|uniref:glycosyltransferase family 2 protein n=1 Tax=Actinomycetospora chiangmaiensis TaxID=402650 RepID=UPI000362823B|nr:glycosyltransferase family 2 protein [Actinomycetospora chiangmaiensis]
MPRPALPTLSVIVPARNEARNLEIVLPYLPADAEIVLVDGHSTDDTVAVVRRLRPDAVVLTQTRRGKGNALACGFAAATGDVIVMFDADGSADPHEIPAFVAALVAGADVAKGTRFARVGDAEAGSEDITLLRNLGNAGLNGLANLALRTRYSDLCYGYNAFWRDVLEVLDLPALDLAGPADRMVWGDGFEIETLLTCRFSLAGLEITEVASIERERIHGVSNLRTFADGLRVLRTLGRECAPRARRRPARRVAVMATAARTAIVPLAIVPDLSAAPVEAQPAVQSPTESPAQPAAQPAAQPTTQPTTRPTTRPTTADRPLAA